LPQPALQHPTNSFGIVLGGENNMNMIRSSGAGVIFPISPFANSGDKRFDYYHFLSRKYNWRKFE
jgi:hypothetical protein